MLFNKQLTITTIITFNRLNTSLCIFTTIILSTTIIITTIITINDMIHDDVLLFLL